LRLTFTADWVVPELQIPAVDWIHAPESADVPKLSLKLRQLKAARVVGQPEPRTINVSLEAPEQVSKVSVAPAWATTPRSSR